MMVKSQEIEPMYSQVIRSGRPRKTVDFGLILALREQENLGWSRVAQEYIKRTGNFISRQTCRRRYFEAKANEGNN